MQVQSEQLHISHTSYAAMKTQLDELSSKYGTVVAEKSALNAEVQELRAAISTARNNNAALETVGVFHDGNGHFCLNEIAFACFGAFLQSFLFVLTKSHSHVLERFFRAFFLS